MRFVLVVACIAALCAVQAQACRLAGDKCIDDGKGCATKRTGAGTCVYYETSPRLIESKIEEARVKFTKKVKKENSNLEGLADDSKAVKKAVKEMMEADESLYEPAHCTCVPVPAQPYAFDTQDDFHSFCNLMYAAYRAAGVCIAGKWLRKPSTKGGDPEPVSCTTEQIAKWAVQGSSVMGKQYNRKETDPDDPTKLIRAPFDGLRTMKDNERGKSDLDTAIESSALLAYVLVICSSVAVSCASTTRGSWL